MQITEGFESNLTPFTLTCDEGFFFPGVEYADEKRRSFEV
jgi:hypothetical protein